MQQDECQLQNCAYFLLLLLLLLLLFLREFGLIPICKSMTFHDFYTTAGFIQSGKVRGKRAFFALVRESQGKSGKLAVVRGKIAFSFCRSGKSFIFHHQRNMYNTLITREENVIISYRLESSFVFIKLRIYEASRKIKQIKKIQE